MIFKPALFTKPSILGNWITKFSISSSLDKSAKIYLLSLPDMRERVSFNFSSFLAVTITDAPILEHSIAVERPIPEDAPVTKITFPDNENGL